MFKLLLLPLLLSVSLASLGIDELLDLHPRSPLLRKLDDDINTPREEILKQVKNYVATLPKNLQNAFEQLMAADSEKEKASNGWDLEVMKYHNSTKEEIDRRMKEIAIENDLSLSRKEMETRLDELFTIDMNNREGDSHKDSDSVEERETDF
ncbi:hypothetical protein AB6A40_000207 [Gnathostoma spinigerum]|uniref:Uncharacterized protein n=1 Tax=Gnathostoma spinigerum TaxID=75299 RepID=A0ABD6E9U5_9BILA